MVSTEEYAILSALIYNDTAKEVNKLALPAVDGWQRVEIAPPDTGSGFVAGAFAKGSGSNSEIVIAIKGTDTDDLPAFLRGCFSRVVSLD